MTINRESDKREYPKRPIPTVVACVFNKDRVLLIKRAIQPSKGRWSVPGGAIELGETIEDAIKREVHEECGIEIDVYRVINVANHIDRDEIGGIQFHYVATYLLAQYVGGELHPASDALDARWVTHGELNNLDMNPIVKTNLHKAFKIACEENLT